MSYYKTSVIALVVPDSHWLQATYQHFKSFGIWLQLTSSQPIMFIVSFRNSAIMYFMFLFFSSGSHPRLSILFNQGGMPSIVFLVGFGVLNILPF